MMFYFNNLFQASESRSEKKKIKLAGKRHQQYSLENKMCKLLRICPRVEYTGFLSRAKGKVLFVWTVFEYCSKTSFKWGLKREMLSSKRETMR